MITILVAMDSRNIIGNKGQLPWHSSEDLKLFKKRTMGHVVIMGRKTWESLPKKPLPGRTNIVVSTTMPAEVFSVNGFFTERSLETAIRVAEYNQPGKEVFIIGGAQIYKEALKKGLVHRILASRIPGKHEGDTFFPELGGEWTASIVENHQTFDVWEYFNCNPKA